MKTTVYIANSCPKCGAKPWNGCRTPDNNNKAIMHKSRKTEIELEPILCGRNIQTFSLPPCENTFIPWGGSKQKRFCSGRCNRLYHSFTWSIEDPERRKKSGAKSDKKYYMKMTNSTPEELEARRAKKIEIAGVSKTPEYRTVQSHYRIIFKSSRREANNYKNMPYFDNWNPDKKGSFRNGYNWIIENLGLRPEGTSLHIIKHELGFVPNNLEWTYPRKQSSEQMFKIIANLSHENKQLRNEIYKLKLNHSPGP